MADGDLENRMNQQALALAELGVKFNDLSKDVNGLVPLTTQLVEVKSSQARMSDALTELVADKRERVKFEHARQVEEATTRKGQTRWLATLSITFLIGVGSILAAVLSHA